MIFMEDPFPYRNTTYDLEGLSDWHKAELPNAKVSFLNPGTWDNRRVRIEGRGTGR